jgi:hypothetical protein
MLNTPVQAVMTKARKSRGMEYPPSQTGYHIRVEGKGKNAKLDVLKMNDTTKQVEYCQSFKVGDTAEHGSYNLKYMGTITAITEKTVTVTDFVNKFDGRVHRMDMHTFCWRNHDLNVAENIKQNQETSWNL